MVLQNDQSVHEGWGCGVHSPREQAVGSDDKWRSTLQKLTKVDFQDRVSKQSPFSYFIDLPSIYSVSTTCQLCPYIHGFIIFG